MIIGYLRPTVILSFYNVNRGTIYKFQYVRAQAEDYDGVALRMKYCTNEQQNKYPSCDDEYVPYVY